MCRESSFADDLKMIARIGVRAAHFLNVGVGPLRTGVFNVADMAIMLGVAVLLLAQRRLHDQETGQTR
jgi:lipoprotein signal peptidase